MSDIAPLGRSHPTPALSPAQRAQRDATDASRPTRGQDRAEFSRAAQLLSQLAEVPDIRQDLVDRVRAEIEAGTYDSDDKLDLTIERLAEDLA